MSHGLPGFDSHQRDDASSSKTEKFITFIIVVLVTLACAVLFVSKTSIAFGKPSDWQYASFDVKDDAHFDRIDFKSGIRRGSLSEEPFASLIVNIVFSKYTRIDFSKFPKCDPQTIINNPQSCPQKSIIAKGSALGLLRPRGDKTGIILSNPKLTLTMFAVTDKDVLVRAYSVISNRFTIPGTLKGIKSSKRYGQYMTLTLPRGAVNPVPGVISQTETIDLEIGTVYKGASMVTVKKCMPRLHFGYWAAYNVNGDKIDIGEDPNTLNSHGLVINQVSPFLKQTGRCSTR